MSIAPNTYLAVEWVYAALCLTVIGTRLAVRRWKRMWSFWVSEVFLVLAFLAYLTLVIGDTYLFTTSHIGFDSYSEAGFQEWLFGSNIVFDLSLYFPRFSLLAFYNELFPISEEGLRKCMYAVMVYTTCAFVTVGFEDLFWCGSELSQNWLYNTNCSLLTAKKNLYINWSIGITAELLVFALPFGMLRRLKSTPRREKMGMIGIFTIGVISIATSIARFTHSALRLSLANTYIIGSTEVAAQIIVVALPALRPLLGVVKKLPSLIDSRLSRGSRSDKVRGGSSSTGQSSAGPEAGSGHDNSYDLPDLSASP